MSRAGSERSTRIRVEGGEGSPESASGISPFDETPNQDTEEYEVDASASDTEQEIRFVREDETDTEGGQESDVVSNADSDVLGVTPGSPRDYIDMTRGDLCMVMMSRQRDGDRILCVCGYPRNACRRSGHRAKQGIVGKEGLPRFYVKLLGSKGACDGRLDRIQLTREEGEKALAESRLDMERVAEAMRNDASQSEDSVEEVTPRLHTIRLDPSPRGSPPETPKTTNPTGRDAIGGTANRDAVVDVTSRWVGVEHPETGERRYCRERPGITTKIISSKYELRATFDTEGQAIAWIGEQTVSVNRVSAVSKSNNNTKSHINISDDSESSSSDSSTSTSDSSGQEGKSSRRKKKNRRRNRRSKRRPRRSKGQGKSPPQKADDDDDLSVEIYRIQPPISQGKTSAGKKGTPNIWYGADKAETGEKAVTKKLDLLRDLQREGYALAEVFQTREEAQEWLHRAKSVARVDRDNMIRTGRRHEAEVDEWTANHQWCGPTDQLGDNIKQPKKTISLNSAEFFRADTAGLDPSVGNKEQIYNVPHDNVDEMDILLCPPHMVASERENFLDTVLDITALPGMFRSGDGSNETTLDTDTATSIVATALGKRASVTDVMWRSPSKNAMSKVKSKELLYDVITGVEKAGRIAFQQQEGRMRAIMYRCNYDRTSIQLYLQAGLLPRIMRATYDRYIALLYKARQKVIENDGTWESGLGNEMILYHSRETMNLRQYSVDWRGFVLQTYVYLRDSEKKSYVDETMYEGLFKRPSVPSSTSQSTKSRDRSADVDSPSVCSHCKCAIGEAHNGGKANCAFTSLDARKAREAGKQFLVAFRDNPRLDKAKKIRELLDEAAGQGS